jgi:hypothetical protein
VKEKKTFIADDGTEFDSEAECIRYENALKVKGAVDAWAKANNPDNPKWQATTSGIVMTFLASEAYADFYMAGNPAENKVKAA